MFSLKHCILVVIILPFLFSDLKAQELVSVVSDMPKEKKNNNLTYTFNEDGSHYVRFTFTNQVWLRYNESNPGSTVFGTPKSETYDIGLRRTRIQVFGQISDRIFVYTQFGQNNLTKNSSREPGIFFLDALAEYKVAGKYLSLGTGLSSWNGPSRYAATSVASILTLDFPLYQLSTLDVTDQFLRKYSVYAKGKIGKLDYRIVAADPMALQQSRAQTTAISANSRFSAEPGKVQMNGYFMYQFLEQESNLTPFKVGSYLGKKRVFNIGAGFVAQKDAMWRLSADATDTVRTDLRVLAVDVFYDAPISMDKGTAITAYASFSSNDYGKNYVRNVGVMNPANGVDNSGSFNGPGNAFPMMGTGNTTYAQVGYLLRRNLFGDAGTLQPFAAAQYSNFDLLDEPMLMFETGANWLIDAHRTKLSFNYQNRPVYRQARSSELLVDSRRGMWVMQFQIAI